MIGEALDRLLTPLAPAWARSRMTARLQIAMLKRALDAGPPDRLSGRRLPPRGGPNTKGRQDLEATRAQARDLYRRNPYGRGTVNSIVANLIGCGIKPQAKVVREKLQTPDEKTNDAIDTLWARWAKRCDKAGKRSFYEIQRSVERELFVAGECLVQISVTQDKTRPVPLVLEVIPSERLSDKEDPGKDGGTRIIQGVEMNADGVPLAYWVYPTHPGDSVVMRFDPVRVPADQMIHIYEDLEPGQVRGLTKFLTVAGAFEGLAQYLDFELAGARTRSAFALMFTQNATGLNLLSTGDTSDTKDAANNDVGYLEGGMIFHGRPGEDLKGVGPSVSSTAFDPFVTQMLRMIARGLDVAYELVARDLTKVTYLSARQGENQDRRHWEPQQEFLNSSFNLPVYERFLQVAALSGALLIKGPITDRHKAVDFVRPGWDWIDPSKDIQGDVTAIQAGLRSPLEVIAKRGGDPYKILREIAQFRDWAKDEFKLELSIFETKPKVVAAPAEPPVSNEAEEDPDVSPKDKLEPPEGGDADATAS
jgi:lambda family phage portal protein